MSKKVLIDCRFIGSDSALGRYAQQLFLNLKDLASSFSFRPILNENLKDKIPLKLIESEPVWTDIPHYSFSEQLNLPQILKKEKPDLIHFTHFNFPLFSPKPFLVTVHDLTISKFKDKTHKFFKTLAYSVLLKQVVKKSNHIIVDSKTTKKDLIKTLKVPEGKVSVIYLGIEKKFRPQPEEKNKKVIKKYNLNSPFLLYSGQWRPHKNLIRLIQAFSILKKEYHIDEKLVLVGKEDPRYPEIKELVGKLGLEQEVLFLGFIDEDNLPAIYSLANLYVIPSLAEGFGFPPLEAMACGTPVASSLASCMPEVLDDSVVFFDPYDVRDMASKIYLALTNNKLRQVLVQRGFKWVKRYDWRKTAEKTLMIYENVLQ